MGRLRVASRAPTFSDCYLTTELKQSSHYMA